MVSIKKEALKLLKTLPDEITWEDIMYEINLKRKVSLALESHEEGRYIDHEEVKKRFVK